MNYEPILKEVIEILYHLDRHKRDILPGTLILSELDFDSLQMLDLIETINTKYGIDFFALQYALEDLRTPESLALAISRIQSTPGTVSK